MENEQAFKQFLEEWTEQCKPLAIHGRTADYIPALKNIDADQLSVAIVRPGKESIVVGDAEQCFTLQSVSKIIVFIAACLHQGVEKVLDYVDVEPTGDPYNSIIRLESVENGKPFNPMINAGAITVSSLLPGRDADEKIELLQQFIGSLIGTVPHVNEEVFQSEWDSSHRNRAIAYYVKASGYILCEVEEALEVYIKQCALEVNVEQLAQIGLIIANNGIDPQTGKQYFSKQIARIAKALMVTCGMYNASGKFAAQVGLPAKSGVSGAIVVSVPNQVCSSHPLFNGGFGIGVYGPAIDGIGNSVAGLAILYKIIQELDLSIF